MVNLAGLAPRAALRAVAAVLEAAGCPDAAYDAGVLYALAAGPGRDPRLDIANTLIPCGSNSFLSRSTGSSPSV